MIFYGTEKQIPLFNWNYVTRLQSKTRIIQPNLSVQSPNHSGVNGRIFSDSLCYSCGEPQPRDQSRQTANCTSIGCSPARAHRRRLASTVPMSIMSMLIPTKSYYPGPRSFHHGHQYEKYQEPPQPRKRFYPIFFFYRPHLCSTFP